MSETPEREGAVVDSHSLGALQGSSPVTHCERCGALCRVSDQRNPDARLLRHADAGLCAGCAMTAFLKTMEPLATVLAAKGPEVLLVPAIQQQAARMLVAANSDASPGEIDWNRVVAQWELSEHPGGGQQ